MKKKVTIKVRIEKNCGNCKSSCGSSFGDELVCGDRNSPNFKWKNDKKVKYVSKKDICECWCLQELR